MNPTPKMSVEEENTKRLTGRAERLGYTIVRIDTTEPQPRIQIRPSSPETYTPELYQDWQTGEWTIQTTSYGTLTIEETQKVAEGYGRAVTMVSELKHLGPDEIVSYSTKR